MHHLEGPHFELGLIDARGRLTRFCKGAKAPKQSKQSKRNERLQGQVLEKQLKDSQEFEMPEFPTPEPVLPAPPLPSVTSSDTIDAARRTRQQAGKRTNSGRGTIFAGETGGYRAAGLGGQKSILG